MYSPDFKKENEVIALFTKKIANENSKHYLTRKYGEKKYFTPIGQWINYQIYSSENHIETILGSEGFHSVIENFIQQKCIQKWFFVRYIDEDGFHLQLRFNLINSRGNGNVVLANMSNYLNSIGIMDYKLVPYKREVNRYKGKNIAHSEKLFFHQSNLVIQLLQFLSANNDENLRWIIGAKLIDVLLNQFNFYLQEKVDITEIMKNGYNREFGIKRKGFKDFNRKYKENKETLNRVIEGVFLKEIKSPVQQYAKNSQKLIASLSDNLSKQDRSEILDSYGHMMLNKLFVVLPRHHEVYIYNIMNSYYKGKMYSTQNNSL